MHRIIKSHLSRFANSFGYTDLETHDQFELFLNYCCVSTNACSRFDPMEVTSKSDDAGLDGIAIIIDDEVITTKDAAEDLFKTARRSRDVIVVFTQAKSGEAFSKSDILSFGAAVANFLMEVPNIPLGEVEETAKETFDCLIENIHKIRGGKPACRLYFATTGVWQVDDPNLTGALEHIRRSVDDEGLFSEVAAEAVDRQRLLKMWTESYEPVEATFKVLGYAPIPSMSGVSQAYMAVVPAANFISEVLDGGDGRIRTAVFQENVRSFLGVENLVNSRITETLSDDATRDRFAVLNNGVTIVAPEVKIQSDQVYIRNFQIVNGCQTSHVLFQERARVDASVVIPMKVIESDDTTVVSQIVEATNSQSQIEQTQFLSLRRKVREVEEFFNTFEGDQGLRIYLERRERQYSGMDIPNARIIDVPTLARSYAAMFLELPHMAARYPQQLMEQLSDRLFQEGDKAEAYYAAAFSSYRLQSFYSNRVLPGNYSKYRWHILLAIKYLVIGASVPQVSSAKMQKAAMDIVEAIRKSPSEGLVKDCVAVFKGLGEPGRDRIKGRQFATMLRNACLERRASGGKRRAT